MTDAKRPDELVSEVRAPSGMWDRLVGQADDTVLLAGIALVFCVIRTVLQPTARSVRSYLAMFFVSVPVGMLAGRIASDAGLSDSACFTATAIASLLAQDICVAILKNNGLIQRALENLVDTWTGGSRKEK